MDKGEWFKLEEKKSSIQFNLLSPLCPTLRPDEKDGSFLNYKSKLHSINVVISLALSLTWQAQKTWKVYILKKDFQISSCFVWKMYDSAWK